MSNIKVTRLRARMFSGLASIPAPILGGLIWDSIWSSTLILAPILIDLLMRIPLITTIPEKQL